MLNPRVELAPVAFPSSNLPTLIQALEHLLRVLVKFPLDDRISPFSSEEKPISWEDEDYSYIEAGLEHGEIPFCDICIMEGKVFIRMIREDEPEEPAESLPRLATIVPIEVPLDSLADSGQSA